MRTELGTAPSLYGVEGDRKYLNTHERGRVLVAMEALPPDQALFALTLAWAGARLSEILSVTAASFQIDTGTLAIVTLKRRRHHVREIPLPPELITALDRHFGLTSQAADASRSHQRLWPWHRTTGWRLIKGVMEECGLVGRRACPRGLRHGFGIGTLRAGVPLNLIQRWMGHSRISTTAIYAEATGPEEREIASRFWRASRSPSRAASRPVGMTIPCAAS